jgi:CRISPR-associated protein Cas1
MQSESVSRFPDLRTRKVLVVDGYGAKIHIRRGRLIVEDGFGRQRRERGFARATVEFKRLVVLARSGYVSIEALTWLRDLGIGVVQLDSYGRMVLCSTSLGYDDARLRRAQALATSNTCGLEIARWILTKKIEGQMRVAREIAGTSDPQIEACLTAMMNASSVGRLVQAEASAANAYWRHWELVELPFARREVQKLPSEWRTFGPRSSPLTKGPRLAARPGHAILNLVYSAAELEAVFGLAATGLDPALGIIHRDQVNRSSFALDILEVVRPAVDEWCLRYLRSRVFTTKDFFETRRGNVRVLPPLSHEVFATAPSWGQLLAPSIEHVAGMLATSAALGKLSTPLTQANRREGRAAQRRNDRVRRDIAAPLPSARCTCCGLMLKDQSRSYCGPCLKERKQEQVRAMKAGSRLVNTGQLKTDESKARQSETMRRRNRERAEWNASHPVQPRPEMFAQKILPELQRLSVRAIARATGLSSLYCSQIRRGLRIPHPRHWDALLNLATSVSTKTAASTAAYNFSRAELGSAEEGD